MFKSIKKKPPKVNFLIAGAQKAGTTALHSYLSTHSEIHIPNNKELHFFDNEKNFAKSKPHYDVYHKAFSPNGRKKLLGEATPIYMYWDNAPKRIWQYNPNMKLIIILRNPIERAYSHWNMEYSRGNETLGFSEAIHNESARIREALPLQHRIYSYIDRGFYCQQIKKLWFYFGKENILILKHETLRQQPEKTLNAVTDFLEIAPLQNTKHQEVHTATYKQNISEADTVYLINLFKHEIASLEQLLSWNCKEWLG